jgi:translation initiation factor eIF-2B subunit epsilon
MAMNITFKDLRQVVIPNILSRIPQPNTTLVFNEIINKWCPILLKFTHSEDDQIDVIETIVDHLLKASYLVPRFPLILKLLYDMDLLEENSILEWFKEVTDAAGPLKKIKEAVRL